MTYYIRPRQDLSLSSFASIICVLKAENRPHIIYCTIDSKTGKGVTRIYFPYCDAIPGHGAIATICRELHRNVSDFKLVEVGEDDYDPFNPPANKYDEGGEE